MDQPLPASAPAPTALITGATGFVGGHLVRLLADAGWHLRALVRRGSDAASLRELGVVLVEGDLAAAEAIRAGADGADVVFHLAAATTAPSKAAFQRVNAEGTRNVARAVLEATQGPRRLIYLSSYAACGPSRPGQPRGISEPPAPLTAYGRSKLAGEEAVRAAAEAGIGVVTLRAPAVYGPGDRAFLPYFRLVRRRLAPAPSGPARAVHLIYVEDLARALARAATEAVPPGTYAVAEPRVHAWGEIVGAMARSLGVRAPLSLPLPPPLVRAAGWVAEHWGDALGGAGVFNREKAAELLAPAWVCDLAGSEALLPPGTETPLEEGMRCTAAWYRAHGWL